MQKMAFLRAQIFKIFRGSMTPNPPNNTLNHLYEGESSLVVLLVQIWGAAPLQVDSSLDIVHSTSARQLTYKTF